MSSSLFETLLADVFLGLLHPRVFILTPASSGVREDGSIRQSLFPIYIYFKALFYLCLEVNGKV